MWNLKLKKKTLAKISTRISDIGDSECPIAKAASLNVEIITQTTGK